MGSRSALFCWEIMQCDKSEKCPAKKKPETPCWEIFKEIDDDYRNFFNICRDCIVYVLNAENSALSYQEVKSIIEAKENCKLSCNNRSLPPKSRNAATPPPG